MQYYPLLKQDREVNFDDLPKNCKNSIFKFLPVRDIINFSKTNKNNYAFFKKNDFLDWHKCVEIMYLHCCKYFFNVYDPYKNSFLRDALKDARNESTVTENKKNKTLKVFYQIVKYYVDRHEDRYTSDTNNNHSKIADLYYDSPYHFRRIGINFNELSQFRELVESLRRIPCFFNESIFPEDLHLPQSLNIPVRIEKNCHMPILGIGILGALIVTILCISVKMSMSDEIHSLPECWGGFPTLLTLGIFLPVIDDILFSVYKSCLCVDYFYEGSNVFADLLKLAAFYDISESVGIAAMALLSYYFIKELEENQKYKQDCNKILAVAKVLHDLYEPAKEFLNEDSVQKTKNYSNTYSKDVIINMEDMGFHDDDQNKKRCSIF